MDTLTIGTTGTTEEIRLAFGTFSLGTVLVAASVNGIAAISAG